MLQNSLFLHLKLLVFDNNRTVVDLKEDILGLDKED